MLSGFLKKLLFARQFMIDEGKIEVLGRRQIMLPFEIFSALQALDQKKGYITIKSSMKENMQYYAKRIGTTSMGMLKSSEEVFETFGLGKISIIKLDNSKKTAIVRLFNSPVSGTCGKVSGGCGIQCASLAGLFSFLFSKDVDAEVTQCSTDNRGFCEFIIK